MSEQKSITAPVPDDNVTAITTAATHDQPHQKRLKNADKKIDGLLVEFMSIYNSCGTQKKKSIMEKMSENLDSDSFECLSLRVNDINPIAKITCESCFKEILAPKYCFNSILRKTCGGECAKKYVKRTQKYNQRRCRNRKREAELRKNPKIEQSMNILS